MVLYRVTDPTTGRETTTTDVQAANAMASAQMARWSTPKVTTITTAKGKVSTTKSYAAPASGAVVRNAAGQVVAAGYPNPVMRTNTIAPVAQPAQVYTTKVYSQPLAGPVSPTNALTTTGSVMLGSAVNAGAAIVNNGLAGLTNWASRNPVQAGALAAAGPVIGAAGLAIGMSGGGNVSPWYSGVPVLGDVLGKRGPQGDVIQGSSQGMLVITDDVTGRTYLVKKAKKRRYHAQHHGGGMGRMMDKMVMIAMIKAIAK